MTKILRSLVLVSLAVVVAVPVVATENNPARQNGFSADTAYQIGELDSVNLFNGNLNIYL